MNTPDIPIIESTEPLTVINDDGTAGKVTNSTTIYGSLKGMPSFIVNRRNRAKNRAKIDKAQRNRKSLRILRNARKRQIAQEGQSELPDTRLDPRDRNEFAVSKPLFRGAKEAGRATRHIDRLVEALDDQRIRYEFYGRELVAAAALPETTTEERWAKFQAYLAANEKYHGITPAKTYAEVKAEREAAEQKKLEEMAAALLKKAVAEATP